ncbi:MAG: DNA replication and repair protein RecF, partial [Armatimonadetes bacterium]|nr:DNA replication and repair protein RecF [Armatimonadota bacterium]
MSVIGEENSCESTGRSCAGRLWVRDFRNYAEASIDLVPGHNILVGANGQGKSNMLEAIYALATTRSFRGAKNADVILHHASEAEIGITAGEQDTELKLTYVRGGRRWAAVFGQKLPTVHDLIGRMPAVVFSSSDLEIVSGEPAERRRFLDGEISLVSPAYLKAFSGYKRALEQRNASLRKIREGELLTDALDPWDIQLAAWGAVLRASRIDYLVDIAALAAEKHRELTDSIEELILTYTPADEASTEEGNLNKLVKSRHQDIGAGFTTVGPHRDDFYIGIDGTSSRAFGSRGQQRTAMLAIKLAVVIYWRNKMR